ncbi:putative ATP-dependent helicase [Cercospora beticola]|uniref:Putative ATP-dependent helicase n=1 Tax=Cercospora beticola TaxID=122368 RepID=A0A2G5IDN4_CERBT|nr:putative ATP-dependent helicase [Cercospora beticola]PIB02772.1 putative ATP-dependent helicase [Cercospora beticola]WPB04284.1 hypothetical protein RHO25_008929 [Cercospora beticola]
MDLSDQYDVLLDDIQFKDVQIISLDPDDEEFQVRLRELEDEKAELDTKKAQLEARIAENSRPQNQPNGHTSQNHHDMGADERGFWNSAIGGRPASNHGSNGNTFANPFSSDGAVPTATPGSGVKRPRPQSSYLQVGESAYKRQTPDVSNAATPTSSEGSYEFVPRDPARDSEQNRLFMRAQQAEDAARKRREALLRDEEFARALSQPNNAHASSSRPNVQTTIDFGGNYQRPAPQPTAESSSSQRMHQHQNPGYGLAMPRSQAYGRPQVKAEPPTFGMQQQLPQRPRQSSEVVDLTNDSDDELEEIAPARFTPSDRQPAPFRTGPSVPTYQMPGAFPNTPNNGIRPAPGPAAYGNGANNLHDPNMWMWLQSAMQNQAQAFRSQLRDVGNLVYGASSSNPWDLDDDDDDDDLIYTGVRQTAGYGNYAGNEALYRDRYDTMQHNDPTKTKEEIQELLANIRPDEDMPAHLRVQTPEDLTIRLHKYQEVGLTWLKKQEEGPHKGGILADDMGLGKTIQMLSLMVTRKSEDFRCRTTLIIAPVALLRQWKQEIKDKVKGGRYELSVFTHHGGTKAKNFDDLRSYDVVLTTYGSIASELKKLEKFLLRKKANPAAVPGSTEKLIFLADEAQWYRVILDEAQCIKNRTTQSAKGACLLKAKYRFCVTGTPMMNNVEELFSLIHFLKIKPYCHWEKFRLDFNTPLRSTHEAQRGRAMRQLQILCKSIMLRRTKKSKFEGEPILNLPERSTTVDNPVFDEDEQAFYTALESQSQVQFNKYLRRGTIGQSYSAILVLLLRLRQACCHPHLIKDFGVAAAADMTEDQMLDFAKQLDPQVVERIKSTGGNFECPVCYDAVANPAIFIPCGHDTCSECFSKIADPANAIQQGIENENGGARCPNCRGNINAKRLTDFNSFKKVHMPELLSEAERAEMNAADDEEVVSGVEDDSDDDNDDDEESSSDEDETLGGFIVPPDEEESDEEDSDDDDDLDRKLKSKKDKNGKAVKREPVDEELEEDDDGLDAPFKPKVEEGVAGPATNGTGIFAGHKSKAKKSKSSKGKGKEAKKNKKGAKGKGKAKEKKKKTKGPVTLADLKKEAAKSTKAKKKYLARLRKTYVGSAKIDKTMEILKDIMEAKEGEKVLIFSQWTSLLDLLEIPIDGEGYGYRRYDGSMTATMRADAVDDFKDDSKNVRIMLVSLKAGNAGLNLNMASQVIILDPFWNPYIEEQAIDRAHRIGQLRPVTVHRVLIQGTVEDRIIELQEKKRALISEALDEQSAANLARLGVQELAYLFGVTGDPTQQVNYRAANGRR